MNNIKVGWQLVMNKTMEGFFRVQIFLLTQGKRFC